MIATKNQLKLKRRLIILDAKMKRCYPVSNALFNNICFLYSVVNECLSHYVTGIDTILSDFLGNLPLAFANILCNFKFCLSKRHFAFKRCFLSLKVCNLRINGRINLFLFAADKRINDALIQRHLTISGYGCIRKNLRVRLSKLTRLVGRNCEAVRDCILNRRDLLKYARA